MSDMMFAGDLNLCTANSQTSDMMFAGDLNLLQSKQSNNMMFAANHFTARPGHEQLPFLPASCV